MNKKLKDYLISECNSVADLMDASETDRDRLYYFSAIHAAAQRVANVEFSASLIHLWVVGQWAHTTLIGRFGTAGPIPGLPSGLQAQTVAGHLPEMPVGITSELTGLVRQLAKRIEEDAEFSDLLAAMCEIAYATTGNGFYLLKTGRLGTGIGG